MQEKFDAEFKLRYQALQSLDMQARRRLAGPGTAGNRRRASYVKETIAYLENLLTQSRKNYGRN